MKTLWCWRCQQEMPMLDDDEFAVVRLIYAECFGSKNAGSSIHQRFEPVRRAYERITGLADCHQNAVMHHQRSLYGPPCHACGKPLRTPQARHCAACGAWRVG